ncbi:hypothetical protein M0657_008762 [Pyricularia oryzae]|nr:hypothetical protein M9X92_009105 [Pyricularia oryzae]KAI7916128.1 hypothetical protein M0657_008762 [Pyricularia oryzae]
MRNWFGPASLDANPAINNANPVTDKVSFHLVRIFAAELEIRRESRRASMREVTKISSRNGDENGGDSCLVRWSPKPGIGNHQDQQDPESSGPFPDVILGAPGS